MHMKTSIYLMLCCLPLLAGCGAKQQDMPGEKYKTLTVTTTNQTLQSTYPATLRGKQAVEIRPQVSGTITQICINEGDAVRRGQVLFIIDQVPYRAALETALANVKSAEAQLQTAKLTANSKEELYKEKVVSDFDRQTTRNQLLEAEAAVAQAKAEETNARNNLSYTEVKSPVDGVASMIPYRVGALVSSSITEPLVTVSDDQEIYAYFSMAENQMLDLIQQYGSLEEACQKLPQVGLTMSNGKNYPDAGRIDAMDGITSALVTTTFVFMAVFIPVSFIGGTTGTFYTQFGLTMAAAVAISLLNALTLSPALCALIMTPHQTAENGGKLSFSSRFHIAFDTAFHRLVTKYKVGVVFMLKRKWLAGSLLVVACGGFAFLMMTTKTGLVPNEDMGTVFIDVRTSPGNSVEETRKVMEQVDSCLRTIPQIELQSNTTGNSMLSGQGACNGMFTIRLKDWSERPDKEDAIDAVMEEISRRTAFISSADIMPFTRPMIPGYGVNSGFEVYVQDQKGGTTEDLLKYTRQFLDALNQRPEIGRATTSFDTKFPQYLVEVDAARCKRNGVSPADVLSTLSGYVGGNYASNMNRFSKLYRVMVQAPPQFRLDTESLHSIFVRNDSGEMSPISQYLKLTRVYGSEMLTRFNLFSAIQVNGAAATGYSSGQAIKAIQEVAAQTLPTGYGFEFGGMSREESNTGNTTTLVFVICVVFIYLILCALYESLFVPLAVILSVPFGLAGSFLFARMFGLENNIYLQTGLIMLIGLLSKTAILLTEYASERRRHGMSIMQAAVSAAQIRLRPILMTSLTMIFGMLPLMFSTGVGANGNISIGVGTVGGMLIGTIALLFIVPPLFMVFQYLQEKWMPERQLPKIEKK